MSDRSITICGFPESGKTTYLAALWHLVTARADQTSLRFESLRNGDSSHLNALAARWRDGLTQIRTDIRSNQLVSMNLLDASSVPLRLTFPDLSGESYRVMFEDRDCSPALAEILTSGAGMLFFIHADRIQEPHLVVNVAAQSEALGSPIPAGQEVPWSPTLSPTQIKIVDLLQLLCLPPLQIGFRRIAIVLSAWDKVAEDGRTPEEFLTERLPLLDQYLRSGADKWIWRVYGVSAQGADYEKENEKLSGTPLAKLQQLRALDEPSMRIRVLSQGSESRDLTEPIAWLMS
jgi:Double-GTPase 1